MGLPEGHAVAADEANFASVQPIILSDAKQVG